MTIGVAISTRNRRETFNESLKHWLEHKPAVLVVVDDASDVPVPPIDGVTVIRHDHRKGVAMTKNRGIAELMDAGCTDLFLVDDDCYPVSPDWWKLYVDSPEPHLSFQWQTRGRLNTPYNVAHKDDQHWSITFPRGVMLYATRSLIDTVGGMDPAYGGGLGEHVEWADRIHAAGLTSWPYADVVGSAALWHSVDKAERGTCSSTFDSRDRASRARRCGLLLPKPRPTFMPYREGHGVQDYQLGPRLADTWGGTLDHVLEVCAPSGSAVEFGVGEGNSLRRIAARMPVTGFDSFQGLPEKWRAGYGVGKFACEPPQVENAELVIGLFDYTLPNFKWPDDIGLVHLDADLYSSTKAVLDHLEPHLRPGCYVVFDEYHGYPGADGEHEQRAWKEFADRTGIGWTVIGHGPEQWAIRLT